MTGQRTVLEGKWFLSSIHQKQKENKVRDSEVKKQKGGKGRRFEPGHLVVGTLGYQAKIIEWGPLICLQLPPWCLYYSVG